MSAGAIDALLECARYGELDDIAAYIDGLGFKQDAPVPLLAAAGRFETTMLHMASANGHAGTSCFENKSI
jgi:hypothetical protein